MVEVLRQHPNLFFEGRLNRERRSAKILLRSPSVCPPHGSQEALRIARRLRPFREAISSSTLLN